MSSKSVFEGPAFNDSTFQMNRALLWILGINVVVFVLTMIPGFRELIINWLILYPDHFYLFWQPITYAFVHFQLMHLLSNCLQLLFLGNFVANSLGTGEFIRYYLICAVGGAVAAWIFSIFLYVQGMQMHVVLGASGAVFGVLYAFYKLDPEAVVLFMMIFPVKFKYLLIALGVFNVLSLVDVESGVASYAHLGGLAAGFFYFKYRYKLNRFLDDWAEERARFRHKKLENMYEKQDELLKKIHDQGIHSLSWAEKRFLKRMAEIIREKRK